MSMDAADDRLVIAEVAGGVGVLTLNRPGAMNPLDDRTMAALATGVDAFARRDDVRCVVLTGAGRAFCSGGDLRMYEGESGVRLRSLSREQRTAELRAHAEAARLLHEMDKVTIAMVNGACAGAGIGLAFACDLRIAGESALFRTAFLDVGLGGDYGSAWFLTRALGSARARELMLLSERIGAADALARGMVAQVVPDEALHATTMKLAGRFAGRMPWGAVFAKRNLNMAIDRSLEDCLDAEAANMVAAHAEIGRAMRAARQAAADGPATPPKDRA